VAFKLVACAKCPTEKVTELATSAGAEAAVVRNRNHYFCWRFLIIPFLKEVYVRAGSTPLYAALRSSL
jgi:hypothetical protein